MSSASRNVYVARVRAWQSASVATGPGVLGMMVVVAAAEVGWRRAYGFSSPLLVLPYVVSLFLVGAGLRTVARTERGPTGVAGTVIVGSMASSCLYVALATAKLHVAFAPALVAASLLGAYAARERLRHAPRIRVGSIVHALTLTGFAARTAYFVDRLSLTAARPSGFAWIDTPLWLDIAYGLERGCPVPELLYAGRTANYHFGASALPAAIRAATGLPMHIAYFGSMCLSIVLGCFAFAELGVSMARTRGRGRSALRTILPWCGLIWIGANSFNFPSVAAFPIVLFALGFALRVRPSARASGFWLLIFASLLVTKEVAYLFATLLACGIAFVTSCGRARWLKVACAGGAALVVRPLYDLLVRTDQHTKPRLFLEHLSVEWMLGALTNQSLPFLLTGVAALWAWSTRKRHRRLWLVPTAGFLSLLAGFVLTSFVRPEFNPPMDAFSYSWILKDMVQFETTGAQLALASVALTLLMLLTGRRCENTTMASWWPGAAALAGYAVLNTWRSVTFPVTPEHPEYARPDPVAEVLHQADPRSTVIASNRFNWNDENPYWSAFEGHQFYFLRRGRWTSAYPDIAERARIQEILFATADVTLAQSLLRDAGITHLLVDKAAPPPWTARRACSAENATYCLVAAVP